MRACVCVVVVTVAKISRSGTLPTGKIVLTPKVMSAGVPAPQAVTLQSSLQPQVCTSVSTVSADSTPAPQLANIVPTSQQAGTTFSLSINPSPRIVRPLHQQLPANLSIAPKQLVFITTGNQGVPTVSVASSQQMAASPFTSAITLPVVQQAMQTASYNNSPTVIPFSSLGSLAANMQATAPAPASTIIHGVLPSKKSDGTVSYLPIKFSRPASSVASHPVLASVPVATSLGTSFLSGGGLTIVIPPAATSMATSTQNVQLVTTPQHQQATFHIASAMVAPSTQPSSAPQLQL